MLRCARHQDQLHEEGGTEKGKGRFSSLQIISALASDGRFFSDPAKGSFLIAGVLGGEMDKTFFRERAERTCHRAAAGIPEGGAERSVEGSRHPGSDISNTVHRKSNGFLFDILPHECYYIINTLCTAYKSTVQTEQAVEQSMWPGHIRDNRCVASVGQLA